MPTLTTHSTAPHSAPFTHTTSLSLSASTLTTPEKSAYLSRLRAAVTDHQSRINAALTARMDADKIRDPSSAPAATTEPTSKKRKKNNTQKNKADDEDAEEENYGEEVVEEDDEV